MATTYVPTFPLDSDSLRRVKAACETSYGDAEGNFLVGGDETLWQMLEKPDFDDGKQYNTVPQNIIAQMVDEIIRLRGEK